jgi:beta-glucosidase
MNFDGKKISASVDNTGNYDGKEIVQLYKRFGWLCHQTFKRVKGFQKIILRKGEKKDSHF